MEEAYRVGLLDSQIDGIVLGAFPREPVDQLAVEKGYLHCVTVYVRIGPGTFATDYEPESLVVNLRPKRGTHLGFLAVYV